MLKTEIFKLKVIGRYKTYLLTRTMLLIIITLLSTCYFEIKSQTSGCTDQAAVNFSPSAMINDGTCIYHQLSVSPTKSVILPEILEESSGLVLWNNKLLTHNDSNDNNLYALDTVDYSIESSYELHGTINTDWEEITSDEEYFYVGDFGNNLDGRRKDLKILRVSKNSVLNNEPEVDTIAFSWSDQEESDTYGLNNTDFDCEAFIVFGDSLYLFTKQWLRRRTGIYSLSREPGIQTAKLRMVYDCDGLITGATCIESENIVVLCGYNSEWLPFLILMYDFRRDDFLSGNKRKIMIDLPFHQVEGICTGDGLHYYVSNEKVTTPFGFIITQKIHILDLEPFLGLYLNSNSLYSGEYLRYKKLKLYPNPVSETLTVVSGNPALQKFKLISEVGTVVLTGTFEGGSGTVDVSGIPPGIYLLCPEGETAMAIRFSKF